jgi:hypothetical protein
MSLIIRKKPFTPAPEGVWPAVCVDVVNLGMEDSPWGPLHKCRIVWEISALMPETGNRFIQGQKYTVSLGEKANLYKMLKVWRGKDFTADELSAFDLENIFNKPCQLVIIHTEKEGKVYGNVQTVLKADPKNVLTPSGKYKRVKDREGYVEPKAQNEEPDSAADAPCDETGAVEDDNIPF